MLASCPVTALVYQSVLSAQRRRRVPSQRRAALATLTQRHSRDPRPRVAEMWRAEG